MIAGTLEVQLLANMARFAKDMQDAKNTVTSTANSMNSALATVKTALGALGIGLSVDYFVGFVKGTIDAADHLNDLTQSMGLNIRELGKYQLAVAQNGTTLEGLGKGIKGVTNNLAEHGVALRAAGITGKDTDSVMRQVADIFAKMPDGIEKTTLANKLFGKSGMELIPLLNQGAAGLDLAAEKSAKYAETMAVLAPQADKLNDDLAELGMVSKVAGINMVTNLVPGLTEVTKATIEAARESGILVAMLTAFGGAVAYVLGLTDAQRVSARLKEITEQLATMRKQLASGTLNPPGASSSFFSFLIPDVALGEKRLGQIRDAIAALEKEQAALTPKPLEKPTFDTDAWMAKYKELLKALGVEDDKAAKKAAAEAERYRKLDIDGWVKYIDARTQEYEDMLRAEAKLDQDALNDAARLQAEDLKGWVAMAEAKVQANFDEAQQIAKDQIDAIEKIEAAQKKVDAARRTEWERLWSVVEGTGKQAFTLLMSQGTSAFKAIGQALKTAVIDLLYQLTARRWMIQIGTSISGALGIPGAANAAGSSLGLLGNGVSLVGGMGEAGAFASGFSTTAFASEATSAALIESGTVGVAGAGMEAGALGAMGPAGWIALAALAAYAIFSSEEDAPKVEQMFAMRGKQGELWFGDENISGHPGAPAYDAIASFIDRMTTTYGKAAIDALDISKLSVTEAPGTGWAKTWQDFQSIVLDATKDLEPLAGQVKMTADAAADAAAVMQIANAKRQMEIQIMELSGDVAGALAARREDELAAMDKSLKPLAEQIYALQDQAKAAEEAARANEAAAAAMQTARDAMQATQDFYVQAAADANAAMEDARAAVWEAYDREAARVQQLQADVATARQAVWQAYDTEAGKLRTLGSAMRGFSTSLREAAASLGVGTGAPNAFGTAYAQFRDVARRSLLGDQNAMGQLRQAGSTYYQLGQSTAITHTDVLRILAEVQNAFTDAADVADRQASVADQQLAALQAQVEAVVGVRTEAQSIDALLATFATAKDAADAASAQLAVSLTQVEQLVGIRVGVQTLAQAMLAFANAKTAAGAAAGAVPTMTPGGQQIIGNGISTLALDPATASGGWFHGPGGSFSVAEIQQSFGAHLGAGGNPLDIYNAVKAAGGSLRQLDAAMGWAPDKAEAWARSMGLPVYGGGISYVPQTGPALLHKGERVTTAAANDDLVAEIRALRGEVAAMRNDTRKTATLTEAVTQGQLTFATTAA